MAPKHAMVATGVRDAHPHPLRPIAPLPARFRLLVGTNQSAADATRELMREAHMTLAETADMDVDLKLAAAARNFDSVVKETHETLAESVRSVLGKRPRSDHDEDDAGSTLPGWTPPKLLRFPAKAPAAPAAAKDDVGKADDPLDSDDEGEDPAEMLGDEALDALLARRAEALRIGNDVDEAGRNAIGDTKTTSTQLEALVKPRIERGQMPFIAVDPFAPNRMAKPAIDPFVAASGHLPEARKLVPYAYQEALLAKAKAGNVLAVLETGAGKTLVASLLMEHVMQLRVDREMARQGRAQPGGVFEEPECAKMMFMVVNSVPLCHQQAQMIAANSSLRVGKLHGALGVDLWSTAEWAYNMEHFDVLVLTAQLLFDALAHGFITMPEISLLVFDEGHHAKAHHPFAQILRWFYRRTPICERPKVLGMTASPIDSAKAAWAADGTNKDQPTLAAALALARTFDAEIVTTPLELTEELRKHVHRPTELVVHYDPTPPPVMTPLNAALRQDEPCSTDELYGRFVKAADELALELGFHASDLVWQYALVKLQRRLSRLSMAMDEAAEDVAIKGIESQHLRMYKMLRETIGTHDFGKPIISGARRNVTPKFLSLVDILRCFKDHPTFCGIVFVKRRYSAHLLAAMLRTTPGLDFLRPAIIVGHGAAAGQGIGVGMQWINQTAVLEQFRTGQCNLLVATSVVEEGLDVQPCNVVIRFDPFETHVSYIQSRGRARCAGSHFITLTETGNIRHRNALDQVFSVENALNRFLRRTADGVMDTDEDALAPADKLDNDLWLRNDVTGALLTPHASLGLLMRYTSTLPQGDVFTSRQPVYEVTQETRTVQDDAGEPVDVVLFTCELKLPSSCPIRSIISPPAPTQRVAKRLAAFQACVQLSKLGALNEHFLPYARTAKTLEVEQQNIAVEEAQKRQAKYAKKVADVWTQGIIPVVPQAASSITTHLYVTSLRITQGGRTDDKGTAWVDGDCYRPVIVLTRAKLPNIRPIPLFVEGHSIAMEATPIDFHELEVDAERLEQLFAYTLRFLFAVTHRAFLGTANAMTWFAAPTVDVDTSDDSSGMIDWDAVALAAADKEIAIDIKKLDELPTDSVIVDRAKNNARYFFERIRYDLNPLSPSEGRVKDGGFHNVLEYYYSFSRAAAKMRVEEDQPLLELSRLPRNLSFLHSTPRNDQTPSRKRLQEQLKRLSMPQCCSRLTISASTLRTLYLVPSALHYLDHLLLTRELNQKLFGGKLDEVQLATAIAAPSAMLGFNNEVLELWGDTWLKLASSAILFACMPSAHEGELHVGRLRIVQNATLYLSALELDLFQYLQTRSFSHRLYVPANCEAVLTGEAGEQPPTNVRVIGDKTLADVVEAILGVAVNTGIGQGGLLHGFDLGMDAATALKLRFKLKGWSDINRVYLTTVPRGVRTATMQGTADMSDIERQIDYTFRDKMLLAEALTHPSKLNAPTKSYERLEFLGDAILDFHVLKHIMDQWQNLNVGHLTELKGLCVCNEMLAAMSVHFGWHRLLRHDSPGLHLYIAKLRQHEEAETQAAQIEGRPLRPYWLYFDAPKAVADLIESMLGAVFVDAGFDPRATQHVFEAVLQPFIDRFISPTTISVDSIRQLLEVSQSSGCHAIEYRNSVVEAEPDVALPLELQARQTKCEVVMHGLVVAQSVMGNSKMAKRTAAMKAKAYLLEHPDWFYEHCDCAIVRAELKEAAAAEKARRQAEGLESEDEMEEVRRGMPIDDEDDDLCAFKPLQETG